MTAITASAPREVAPENFRRGARRTWHQKRRHRTVDLLAETMSGDALDYGCGWGDISHRLAPQFRSIIGLDVSDDRVEFARAQYAPIRFERCAEEGLDFADESFDTVLSVVVLPFVPDGQRYLAECHRVLRPNGKFLLLVPNPEGNLQAMYRLLGRTPRLHPHVESRAGLERQLHDLGFDIEQRAGFFDPPFDRLTNIGEFVLGVMNALGHLLRMRTRVSYIGYRLRKRPA